MDEHEDAPLTHELPEVLVDLCIEVLATAAGTDRQPGHPEFVHASPGLGCRVRPAESDVSETKQPIRCARNVLGERVVAPAHYLGNQRSVLGRAGEQEGRQRHGVMADSHSVHLAEPGSHIMLRTRKWQWHIRTHAADLGVESDDPLFDRRGIGEALIGQPPQHRQRHRMRMDVQCLHLLHHESITRFRFASSRAADSPSERMAQSLPRWPDPDHGSIEWKDGRKSSTCRPGGPCCRHSSSSLEEPACERL